MSIVTSNDNYFLNFQFFLEINNRTFHLQRQWCDSAREVRRSSHSSTSMGIWAAGVHRWPRGPLFLYPLAHPFERGADPNLESKFAVSPANIAADALRISQRRFGERSLYTFVWHRVVALLRNPTDGLQRWNDLNRDTERFFFYGDFVNFPAEWTWLLLCRRKSVN